MEINILLKGEEKMEMREKRYKRRSEFTKEVGKQIITNVESILGELRIYPNTALWFREKKEIAQY